MREKLEYEENLIEEMRNTLYNPDFLYKILMILYKCLVRNNDNIIFAAGNPKYVAIAMNLFRSAPPTHRILLMKIINILIMNLPVDIFTVALQSFIRMVKDNPDDAHFFKLMTSGKDDQIVLIEYFMEIFKQSRQRIFQETITA